jgi:transcriptional regulator with XRE-family HTH domain
MTRLGALLRLYRTMHQVSQSDLAREIGITRHRLQALDEDPGGESLHTLAKVLIWLMAPPDEGQPLLAPLLTAPARRPSPGEQPSLAAAGSEITDGRSVPDASPG